MHWSELLLSRHDPVPSQPTLAEWRDHHQRICGQWSRPIDRAIAGGHGSDRLGWAFCCGYQAALRNLVPALPDAAVAALCATEQGGNRPRHIESRLQPGESGWQLSGSKRWATLGPTGSRLLVVARLADAAEAGNVQDSTATEPDGTEPGNIEPGNTEPGERPTLRLVSLPADREGIRFQSMHTAPFIPEVPHAEVHFDSVPVASHEMLEGDGYLDYLKPFRTIEDIHIQAAGLGYLVREARVRGWPHGFIEEALAALQVLDALSETTAPSSASHLLLAGAQRIVRRLLDHANRLWATASPEDRARQRWERDRDVLSIARAARAQRRASAWQHFDPDAGPGPTATGRVQYPDKPLVKRSEPPMIDRL